MKKFGAVLIAIILIALAGFFYFRFYYVFGEGVKSGELNYVVYKGIIFKTYEGKLIQSGIRSNKGNGIQSYEFEFSVADEELAKRLMNEESGKVMQLHYKEYFGALPWRGYTKYIVDDIVSIQDKPAGNTIDDSALQGVAGYDGEETLVL